MQRVTQCLHQHPGGRYIQFESPSAFHKLLMAAPINVCFVTISCLAVHLETPTTPRSTPIPIAACSQSVLATFRSQKVGQMTFHLTPDARLSVALDCDNGEQLQRSCSCPGAPSSHQMTNSWQLSSLACHLAQRTRPTVHARQALPRPSPQTPNVQTPNPATAPGLVKRYRLDVMDADILHASVDKDACPTSVVAEAAELNKWVAVVLWGGGGW